LERNQYGQTKGSLGEAFHCIVAGSSSSTQKQLLRHTLHCYRNHTPDHPTQNVINGYQPVVEAVWALLDADSSLSTESKDWLRGELTKFKDELSSKLSPFDNDAIVGSRRYTSQHQWLEKLLEPQQLSQLARHSAVATKPGAAYPQVNHTSRNQSKH